MAILALAGLILAAPLAGRAQAAAARQVTVFAIVASPRDPAIDPKLEPIALQLRDLLPHHGFKLLDVQSKRLLASQMVRCHLGGGYTAATTLIVPLDTNGKVELRCELLLDEISQLETLVATPPNQLFFCDKLLMDGSHLLIGVGAMTAFLLLTETWLDDFSRQEAVRAISLSISLPSLAYLRFMRRRPLDWLSVIQFRGLGLGAR